MARTLRNLPLIERKRALRKIIPSNSAFLLYVDHIEAEGERMFQFACERDLEGIVAKHRQSRYSTQDHIPAWVKIGNRKYSQLIGRDELFERRYEASGAPEIGWGVCDRVCAVAPQEQNIVAFSRRRIKLKISRNIECKSGVLRPSSQETAHPT